MDMEDVSQVLLIPARASKIAHKHGLILTVKELNLSSARIVYGTPGAVNANKIFELGDAELFETTSHGIVELRLLGIRDGQAEILLTKVSPRLGFAAAIDLADEQNRFFTLDEKVRIRTDIERVKTGLSASGKFSPEQERFLSLKFSEIAEASERMGRKDWIMYVTGTLTSVITSAAFDPLAAKALFSVVNANLDWVFNNLLRLVG